MTRSDLITEAPSPLSKGVPLKEQVAEASSKDDLLADTPSHDEQPAAGDDAKFTLTEDDHPQVLASAFSTRKKWTILSVIFLVQTSMNFNTSLYANGQSGMAEAFNVSRQTTVTGAAVFLITYAFGCELSVNLHPFQATLG